MYELSKFSDIISVEQPDGSFIDIRVVDTHESVVNMGDFSDCFVSKYEA